MESMVVYRALYGDYEIYVRPLSMFFNECNDEQYKEYGQRMRFILVNLNENNPNKENTL